MLDNNQYNNELRRIFDRMNNNYYLMPELHPTKPLYRYRSNIDYTIDEIKNSYVFLSPIESLNDPFDSSYIVTMDKARNEKRKGKNFYDSCYFISRAPWYRLIKETMIRKEMYDNYISMDEFFGFLVKEIYKYDKNLSMVYTKQSMMELYYEKVFNGIHHNYGYSASFSERYDNILMWSYYANSHKGICLGYDLNRLDLSNDDNKVLFNSLKKVWYSTERYEDSDGKYTPFLKAQEWSHEQEWRMFNRLQTGKIQFPCLKAVYLGMSFDYDNNVLDRIIDAIKENPLDISLYSCQPDVSSYKINTVRILL